MVSCDDGTVYCDVMSISLARAQLQACNSMAWVSPTSTGLGDHCRAVSLHQLGAMLRKIHVGIAHPPHGPDAVSQQEVWQLCQHTVHVVALLSSLDALR